LVMTIISRCETSKRANEPELGIDNQSRREINIFAHRFDGRHGEILKAQRKKLASSFLFGISRLFTPAKLFLNAEIALSKVAPYSWNRNPGKSGAPGCGHRESRLIFQQDCSRETSAGGFTSHFMRKQLEIPRTRWKPSTGVHRLILGGSFES
jgi:hypothetical protein